MGTTNRAEPTSPARPFGTWAGLFVVVGWLCVSGCLGSRFNATDPAVADPAGSLDAPTRAVFDRINGDRKAANLADGNLVPELRPPVTRAALTVARGDKSLKTAANDAARDGVTDLGRHVWTFATECSDPQRFRPPLMALQQKTLLLGVAAVPAPGGRTIVVLAIAEPGPSSIRADQMGGGPGGSKPNVESYAHPSVASGPCGETWPASQRMGF